MNDDSIEELLRHITRMAGEGKLVKLTLSKPKQKNAGPRNVFVKPVIIKGVQLLSFVYSEEGKHTTQNLLPDQAVEEVRRLLGSFRAANLFGVQSEYEWLASKSGNSRLVIRQNDVQRTPNLEHDRRKSRFLDPLQPYWFDLGITSREGVVLPSMQHKFKQVDKYIGLLEPLMPQGWSKKLKVVDMGSGKAYLTFAFYEYLKKKVGNNFSITGVEQRAGLVELTNRIARNHKLEGLDFVEGSINSYPLSETDILIALHACDTATDDAIAAGIHAGASLIVCAPCCHKQVRQEILSSKPSLPMFRYGILLERQAEILTDTLRALLMEKYSYKTRIMEFIEAEHTPKNIMLAGVKHMGVVNTVLIDEQIAGLKHEYGIATHYLETALEKRSLT
jgi:hypothetical protein